MAVPPLCQASREGPVRGPSLFLLDCDLHLHKAYLSPLSPTYF